MALANIENDFYTTHIVGGERKLLLNSLKYIRSVVIKMNRFSCSEHN